MDRYRDFGPTVIRAFAATFLVYMSQDNVFSDERMAEFERFLQRFGFPMVPLSARVSVYAQFTAGLLFAVGLFVRPAAGVMVVNFVVALAAVHTQQPFQAALAPSAMLASALSLFVTGAGALALDGRLALRRHRRKLLLLLCAMLLPVGEAVGQAPADSAAIRATALDYIDGWYAGDAERMRRALHPALAKRIVYTNRAGRTVLDHTTADQLVAQTRERRGTRTPPERHRNDVSILDVYQRAASVRITAGEWVDYLHMAHVGGRWVIVNVLWELTRRPAAGGVRPR